MLPEVVRQARLHRHHQKKSDAYAVLVEMVEVIADALKASKRVHIDGFGTFKIGISSRGADSVEDFTVNENIKSCRVLFQPEVTTDPATHKRLKKMTQGMTFQSPAPPYRAGSEYSQAQNYLLPLLRKEGPGVVDKGGVRGGVFQTL